MKKNLILVLSVLLASFAMAEQLGLWTRLLPTARVALETQALPQQLFGGKMQTAPVDMTAQADMNTQLQGAIARLQALTVTALVWSSEPQNRRVLMGDIVLREGQSIPSYVFGDGRFYTLKNIFQNSLTFSMQEGAFGTPESFSISFELTDPIKNTSKYSDGASKE